MNEAMFCLAKAGFTAGDLIIGTAVGMAESGLETDRIGLLSADNEDLGVWQISTKWHYDKILRHGGDWRNPFVNATLAREIWLARGGDRWSAWNAYNAGKHEQYMARATTAFERGALWAPRPWLGSVN
jgi:hypothetical protein